MKHVLQNVFLDICRQMRKKSLAKDPKQIPENCPLLLAGADGQEFKGTAKEILGTCFAVGCTVDGQKPIVETSEQQGSLPLTCLMHSELPRRCKKQLTTRSLNPSTTNT